VTLVQGSGPAIRKGQLFVAQYVGVLWRTGKEFDSSWDRGQPVGFPIGVGRVIAGWDEKLVGVQAGSRVLLVLPPSKGYGPQGEPTAGIKGDDTLVFVVDVLAGY
jgi:peptidylprolyl isomerase